MAGLFDDETLDIPCPGCGKEHQRTIAWIKSNDLIPCDCGANIRLQSDGLKRGLQETEEALSKIPQKITIKI